MDTGRRIEVYAALGRNAITAKQGRRLVKKAGADPTALVERQTGMGYAHPAERGRRHLIGFQRQRPTDEKE